MKTIAITGISGYIGSKLLSRLENMDEVKRVVGIDIRPPKYSSPKLTFYCQDISLPLGNIFLENKVDTAIHLAFILKPTRDRVNTQRVDIGGILNFLEASRQAGKTAPGLSGPNVLSGETKDEENYPTNARDRLTPESLKRDDRGLRNNQL